jgi:hypothetical protein
MPDIAATTHVKVAPTLDTDELATEVRRELEEVRRAGCSVLHHALNAGDALNAAQKQVTGNWKRWLKEHCFLSVRTALVYQQLARHRSQIEDAMRGLSPELSLRGALRLIGTPKKGGRPVETLATHWRRESEQARTAFLDQVGVPGILEAMSAAFGRDLRARLPAPKRKAGKPNKPYTATLQLVPAGTDASGNPNYAHQPRAPSSRQ